MAQTCCVVDLNCLSPANLSPPVICRAKCFACGQPVCVNCSVRIAWVGHGVHRICHNCLEDYDGNDVRVLAHLEKLA